MGIQQYQDEFLVEFDELWITPERMRLADAYQIALRRLVQTLMEAGQNERALAAAQKAVTADPYREETHRLLMQVYHKLGRPTAAVRQFEELERLAHFTTGIRPSNETKRALAKVCEAARPPAPRGRGRRGTRCRRSRLCVLR